MFPSRWSRWSRLLRTLGTFGCFLPRWSGHQAGARVIWEPESRRPVCCPNFSQQSKQNLEKVSELVLETFPKLILWRKTQAELSTKVVCCVVIGIIACDPYISWIYRCAHRLVIIAHIFAISPHLAGGTFPTWLLVGTFGWKTKKQK